MKELKDEKLISIIVPIYKVEKYLNKCVESLVMQTYKNLEIILVDDGSPDNCPIICDEWARKDARIKVIHKPNGGLSDARNCGIDVATGEYIMFVDSDDAITKNACEVLSKTLEKNNNDFVMGAVNLVNEGSCPVDNVQAHFNEHYYDREKVINEIYKTSISYLVIACAKLYKRALFDNLRFKVGKLHEDEFLFHHLMFRVNSFTYIDYPVYNYLIRADGIMGSASEKNLQNSMEAFCDRYEFMQANLPENKEKNVNMYLFNLRSFYVSKRVNKNFRKLIKKEFKKIYKEPVKKNILNKLFNFSTVLYSILYNLYKR